MNPASFYIHSLTVIPTPPLLRDLPPAELFRDPFDECPHEHLPTDRNITCGCFQ